MTTTTPTPWELSLSHESHYHEAKEHVQRVLDKWDAGRYNDWPTRARFVSISEPTMTPAWFNQIVEIGKRGIKHSVSGLKLAKAFPQRSWEEWSHDVYFIEPVHGNVIVAHADELYAYIVGVHYVRCVHLGCNHPNATTIRKGNAYRHYHCEACGFEWGEDSSD